MYCRTLKLIPLLLVAAFGLLFATPLLGRGENASTALDEYARYFPGNPIPSDLSCRMEASYYEEYHTRCHVDGGTHCEFGQITGDRGRIVQVTLHQCRFPLAYLIAKYGHQRHVQRYRHSTILRWPSVYVQVSSIGWLDAMQPVRTVTWWRPVEVNIPGS
jgi:hypothetical protein